MRTNICTIATAPDGDMCGLPAVVNWHEFGQSFGLCVDHAREDLHHVIPPEEKESTISFECELSASLLIEWQETSEESYIDAQLKKWDEVVAILRANGIRVKEATGEFFYPDHQVQDDDKDPIQDEKDVDGSFFIREELRQKLYLEALDRIEDEPYNVRNTFDSDLAVKGDITQDDDRDPIQDEEEYYDLTCDKHGTRYPIFGFCPPCEEEAAPIPPALTAKCLECGEPCTYMFCDYCAPSHDPMR